MYIWLSCASKWKCLNVTENTEEKLLETQDKITLKSCCELPRKQNPRSRTKFPSQCMYDLLMDCAQQWICGSLHVRKVNLTLKKLMVDAYIESWIEGASFRRSSAIDRSRCLISTNSTFTSLNSLLPEIISPYRRLFSIKITSILSAVTNVKGIAIKDILRLQ